MVILDVIHQVRSVTFDLLWRGDGAKDDLSEALSGEHSEADTTDGPAIFDQRQSPVLTKNKQKIIQKIKKHVCFKRLKINLFIIEISPIEY